MASKCINTSFPYIRLCHALGHNGVSQHPAINHAFTWSCVFCTLSFEDHCLSFGCSNTPMKGPKSGKSTSNRRPNLPSSSITNKTGHCKVTSIHLTQLTQHQKPFKLYCPQWTLPVRPQRKCHKTACQNMRNQPLSKSQCLLKNNDTVTPQILRISKSLVD